MGVQYLPLRLLSGRRRALLAVEKQMPFSLEDSLSLRVGGRRGEFDVSCKIDEGLR